MSQPHPAIFNRVHDLLIRLNFRAGGKAQSLAPSVSSGKAGSTIPDFQVIREQRELEGSLNYWLSTQENCFKLDVHQDTMSRWHAAIVATNDAGRDQLIEWMGEVEKKLRIEWKADGYRAMPAESMSELKFRRETTWLREGHGFGTKAYASLIGETEKVIEHFRQEHGIDGRTGHRRGQCEQMVRLRSEKQSCAVCALVDKLDALPEAA